MSESDAANISGNGGKRFVLNRAVFPGGNS